MGVTSPERSALEQLSAARRRGDAKPDELLELAEAAVDQAADAADALSLEKIAAELESAAPALPNRKAASGFDSQRSASVPLPYALRLHGCGV